MESSAALRRGNNITTNIQTESVMKFEEIMRYSRQLHTQWVLLKDDIAMDDGSAKRLASIGKIISMKKGISNRRLLEQYLRRICSKYALTKRIDRLCGESFDNKNTDHKRLLENLWKNLKPKETFPGVPNERWKELGFQGSDPASDFRSVGIFGLRQLVAFTGTDSGQRAYEEAQYGPYWYSFAIVSLNVSNHICMLLKSRQFNRLLYSGDLNEEEGLTLLDELTCVLFLLFHKDWMDAKPLNLFAFSKVFAGSCIRFNKLFVW